MKSLRSLFGSYQGLLNRKVPKSFGCLVLAVLVIVIWGIFEIEAQHTVLAGPVTIYRDPDHRLRPNDPRAGTNGDGLRSALEAADIPDSACTVLFAGDSFVFGVQVEREQALPQRFEAGLRAVEGLESTHVVNAAWESASPLLALRLLRDVGPEYRPDLVLYGFDMTDFRDDLMYRNLIDRQGVYALSHVAPASLWLLNRGARGTMPESAYQWLFRMPTDRFFAINQALDDSREFMLAAWDSLLEIDTFCRDDLGADFRLVVLPRNFQYSNRESPSSWEAGEYQNLGPHVLEPFRFFAERAKTAPFPVHSLLPAFQGTNIFPTCFTGDPHWTPAGTQVAADALVEMCLREAWMKSCARE